MAKNITSNPLTIDTNSDTDKVYEGTFKGDLQGNADSATKLKDPVTITFAGDVSGSCSTSGANTQARLQVNRALRADSAAHADSADNVANADYAKTAGYAANAGTATKATTATNASKADLASKAIEADLASLADVAKQANNASQADHAVSADNADYAKTAGTANLAKGLTPDAAIVPKAGYAEKAHTAEVALYDCKGRSIPDFYALKEDVDNTYLKKTDASNTYLTQTDANKDYLKKTDAGNTYQTKEDMENYMPKSGGGFTGGVTVPDQTSVASAAEGAVLNKKDVQSLIDNSIEQSGGGGGEQANNIKPVDSYPADSDLIANYLYAKRTDTVIDGIKIKDSAGIVSAVDFTAMKQATTAAQAQADKGVADAANAQSTANTAKQTADTNAGTITTLQNDMTTVKGNITSLQRGKVNTTDYATLETFGITKYSSAVNNNAENLSATPKAVKTAYDLANNAKTIADGALQRTGGTVTGLTNFSTIAPTILTQTSDSILIETIANDKSLNKGDIIKLIQYYARLEKYKDQLENFPDVRFVFAGGDKDKEYISEQLENTDYIIWEHISIPKVNAPHLTPYFGVTWQDPDNANNILLPDPNEYFLMMVTDPSKVGVSHNAQAPNIKGYGKQYYDGRFDITPFGFASLSGAFSLDEIIQRDANIQYENDLSHPKGYNAWKFSANKSNSTYADGAALRPQSITVLVLIKI